MACGTAERPTGDAPVVDTTEAEGFDEPNKEPFEQNATLAPIESNHLQPAKSFVGNQDDFNAFLINFPALEVPFVFEETDLRSYEYHTSFEAIPPKYWRYLLDSDVLKNNPSDSMLAAQYHLGAVGKFNLSDRFIGVVYVESLLGVQYDTYWYYLNTYGVGEQAGELRSTILLAQQQTGEEEHVIIGTLTDTLTIHKVSHIYAGEPGEEESWELQESYEQTFGIRPNGAIGMSDGSWMTDNE